MVLVSTYIATIDTWGHVVHLFTIIDIVGIALSARGGHPARAGTRGGGTTSATCVATAVFIDRYLAGVG